LEEDHRQAKEIGEVLSALEFIKKVEPIETNIVIFKLDESKMSSGNFLSKLEENSISIIGMGQGKLRIVTHLDYTDQMHRFFLDMLKNMA